VLEPVLERAVAGDVLFVVDASEEVDVFGDLVSGLIVTKPLSMNSPFSTPPPRRTTCS
jgi:hypothetical protein